ncbi:MAG TPA: CBS domain-containing protein [Acidimicrobiales bacterium]|jgi:CBS domain-containing protein|nr:CBS domain-containing protein [Acidimicrobiales bacterium]
MPQHVRDLMTADPVTLPADATVLEAARRMRDADIGDIVVLDGDRMSGLVTDRDLVVRALAEGRDPSQTSIGEVSSRDLATLDPDASVEEAIRIVRQRAVRRIPVAEDGRPVGVVSIGDLAVERDESSALADVSAAAPNR